MINAVPLLAPKANEALNIEVSPISPAQPPARTPAANHRKRECVI
nr:hypothetical protein CPGR_02516 [Mycolicibacter nonchromogenicus]